MTESTVCGNCGETIIEPASTPVEKRQPCPNCGSTRRNFSVELTDSIIVSASFTATLLTYPNALLTIARSLIDQGHFDIAVVNSHMACEVAAERAFDAAYAAKKLEPLGETNETKTFDVFCNQCNLQTTARVVAAHIKTTPINPHKALTDPVDTPYYVTEYAIALCSKCETVFLVESEFYEMPGEVCAPQGISVLYPSDRNVSTDGMPETASRAYAAAARSYQVGLYEPCVIMCRKCIEALCQELGAKKGNLIV